MLIRVLLIASFLLNPLGAATGAACGPDETAACEIAGAAFAGHSCCCGDACTDLGRAPPAVATCPCAGETQPAPAPAPGPRVQQRELALVPRPIGLVPVSAAPTGAAIVPVMAPRSWARSINSLVCVWVT